MDVLLLSPHLATLTLLKTHPLVQLASDVSFDDYSIQEVFTKVMSWISSRQLLYTVLGPHCRKVPLQSRLLCIHRQLEKHWGTSITKAQLNEC